MTADDDRTTLRQLRRARCGFFAHYVRHLFVIAALARRYGNIADPWDLDARTHIMHLRQGLLCAVEEANAGCCEVHIYCDADRQTPRELVRAVPDALRPALVSLNAGQRQLAVELPGVRRRELDEILYWSDAHPGSAGRRQSDLLPDGLVTLRRDGRDAVARTGAYPSEFLHLIAAKNAGTDAAVLKDAGGSWLTRCHLEPLDIGVAEVCGLETHPQHRRCGGATRLLDALRSVGSSFALLTVVSNVPARRAAESAGFRPVDRHCKLLLT